MDILIKLSPERYETIKAVAKLKRQAQSLEQIITEGKILKKGRWIGIGYDGYADGFPIIEEWECSECGYEHFGDVETLTSYCPDCGTEMEIKEE